MATSRVFNKLMRYDWYKGLVDQRSLDSVRSISRKGCLPVVMLDDNSKRIECVNYDDYDEENMLALYEVDSRIKIMDFAQGRKNKRDNQEEADYFGKDNRGQCNKNKVNRAGNKQTAFRSADHNKDDVDKKLTMMEKSLQQRMVFLNICVKNGYVLPILPAALSKEYAAGFREYMDTGLLPNRFMLLKGKQSNKEVKFFQTSVSTRRSKLHWLFVNYARINPALYYGLADILGSDTEYTSFDKEKTQTIMSYCQPLMPKVQPYRSRRSRYIDDLNMKGEIGEINSKLDNLKDKTKELATSKTTAELAQQTEELCLKIINEIKDEAQMFKFKKDGEESTFQTFKNWIIGKWTSFKTTLMEFFGLESLAWFIFISVIVVSVLVSVGTSALLTYCMSFRDNREGNELEAQAGGSWFGDGLQGVVGIKGFGFEDVNKRFMDLGRYKSSVEAIKYFGLLIKEGLDRLYKLMFGKHLFPDLERVDIFIDDFQRLSIWISDNKKGSAEEFVSLYRKVHQTLPTLAGALKDYMHYSRVLESYKDYYIDCLKDINGKSRPTPVCLYLCGESSTGKSYLAEYLAKILYASFSGNSDYETVLYRRNVMESYWSGYKGQFCVLYDDILQTIEEPNRRAMQTMEIIDTVNSVPYNLNMADIGSKGCTFFNSPLVVLTSNDVNPQNLGIKCPEAFFNRLSYKILVEMKKNPGPKFDLRNEKVMTLEVLQRRVDLFLLDHNGKKKAITLRDLATSMLYDLERSFTIKNEEPEITVIAPEKAIPDNVIRSKLDIINGKHEIEVNDFVSKKISDGTFYVRSPFVKCCNGQLLSKDGELFHPWTCMSCNKPYRMEVKEPKVRFGAFSGSTDGSDNDDEAKSTSEIETLLNVKWCDDEKTPELIHKTKVDDTDYDNTSGDEDDKEDLLKSWREELHMQGSDDFLEYVKTTLIPIMNKHGNKVSQYKVDLPGSKEGEELLWFYDNNEKTGLAQWWWSTPGENFGGLVSSYAWYEDVPAIKKLFDDAGLHNRVTMIKRMIAKQGIKSFIASLGIYKRYAQDVITAIKSGTEVLRLANQVKSECAAAKAHFSFQDLASVAVCFFPRDPTLARHNKETTQWLPLGVRAIKSYMTKGHPYFYYTKFELLRMYVSLSDQERTAFDSFCGEKNVPAYKDMWCNPTSRTLSRGLKLITATGVIVGLGLLGAIGAAIYALVGLFRPQKQSMDPSQKYIENRILGKMKPRSLVKQSNTVAHFQKTSPIYKNIREMLVQDDEGNNMMTGYITMISGLIGVTARHYFVDRWHSVSICSPFSDQVTTYDKSELVISLGTELDEKLLDKDQCYVCFMKGDNARNISHMLPKTVTHSVTQMARLSFEKGLPNHVMAVTGDADVSAYSIGPGRIQRTTGIRFTAFGRKGECGLPYVTLNENPDQCLQYIHVAGSENSSLATELTYNDYQNFLNMVQERNKVSAHFLTASFVPPMTKFGKVNINITEVNEPSPYPGYDLVGYLDKKSSQPSQTNLRKSMMWQVGEENLPFPNLYEPAKLYVEGEDLHAKTMVKNTGKTKQSFAWMEDDSLFNGIFVPQAPRVHKELTMQECIQGTKFAPGLAKDTACGPGFTICGVKKDEIIDFENGEIKEPYNSAFVEMELNFKKGNIVRQLVDGCLKDELRLKEKVAQLKTRTFFIFSVLFNLLTKKYFGYFCEAVLRAMDTDIGAGFNPFSSDWRMIVAYLKEKGELFDFSDASAWDLTYWVKFRYHFLRRYQRFTSCDEQTMLTLYGILTAAFRPYVCIRRSNKVCVFEGNQMCSGWYGTLTFNSFYHSWRRRAIWKKYCMLVNADLPFHTFNRLKVCGDDAAHGYELTYHDGTKKRKLIGWGADFISEMSMELFNSELTDCFKGGKPRDMKLEEGEFLKRKMVTIEGRVVAPLSKDTIQRMVLWVHKNDVNSLEVQFVQNAHGAIREAFFHGRDYYEWFRDIMNKFLRKTKLRDAEYMLTYGQQRAILEQDLHN